MDASEGDEPSPFALAALNKPFEPPSPHPPTSNGSPDARNDQEINYQGQLKDAAPSPELEALIPPTTSALLTAPSLSALSPFSQVPGPASSGYLSPSMPSVQSNFSVNISASTGDAILSHAGSPEAPEPKGGTTPQLLTARTRSNHIFPFATEPSDVYVSASSGPDMVLQPWKEAARGSTASDLPTPQFNYIAQKKAAAAGGIEQILGTKSEPIQQPSFNAVKPNSEPAPGSSTQQPAPVNNRRRSTDYADNMVHPEQAAVHVSPFSSLDSTSLFQPTFVTPPLSPVRSSHPSGIPRQHSAGAILGGVPTPPSTSPPRGPPGFNAFIGTPLGLDNGVYGQPQHLPPPPVIGGPTPRQLQEAAMQALQQQSPRLSPLPDVSLNQANRWTTPTVAQQLQNPLGSIQYSGSIGPTSPQKLQLQQRLAPVAPAGLAFPQPLHLQDAAFQSLQASPNLSPRPSGDFASQGTISPPPVGEGPGSFPRADSWSPLGASVSFQSSDMARLFPFPAARYSTSLDSLRGAPGDEWLATATAAATAAREGHGGLQISDSAASMLQRLQISAQRYPKASVRAILNTGGKFSYGPSRDVHYEGGEVRLVSLPENCSFAELIAVLAKLDRPSLPTSQTPSQDVSGGSLTKGGTATDSVSAPTLSPAAAAAASLIAARQGAATDAVAQSSRVHCILRYQLPSDPSLFVDVVDDEDVKLMFEEHAEIRARQGPVAPKLRIYVQWIPPGSNEVLERTLGQQGGEESEEFLSPAYSGLYGSSSSLGGSDEGAEGAAREGGGYEGDEERGAVARGGAHAPAAVHAAHKSASDLRLAAVRSDQLEVIPATEVTLVELLGTGTFGDMYRGLWRNCAVAVKCLNPAAIGLQYTSQAAWLAFLNDANSSAALRHPSLVEVYGIVLPGGQEIRSQQAQQWAREGHSLDQKMGGRRMSWDFGGSRHTRDSTRGRGDLTPRSKGNTRSSPFGPSTTTAAAAASPPPLSAPLFGGSMFTGGPDAPSTPWGLQRLPGPVASTPAIVMEYVSGRSLRGAIERREDIVAGALARVIYAMDVASAMAYLHRRNVPHFDLKSSNVLLGWRNLRPAAKVAGYGLTASHNAMSTYTPGITMSPGVFPWIAPEIFRSPHRVSHKADVYSFGIILWELWALRPPYESKELHKLTSLAVNTEEEVRPMMPPEGAMDEPAPAWSELVKRCWAEDPDERPEFVEIEKELRKMAKTVKEAQRKPESAGQRTRKESSTTKAEGGKEDKAG